MFPLCVEAKACSADRAETPKGAKAGACSNPAAIVRGVGFDGDVVDEADVGKAQGDGQPDSQRRQAQGHNRLMGVLSRTAYVWRMKVYAAALEIKKSTALSGKCWTDEALVPVNEIIYFRFEGGKMRTRERFEEPVCHSLRGRFRGKRDRPTRHTIYHEGHHPKLQQSNSFIAELKYLLRCHVGFRTEYLRTYAAWVAFKSSVRNGGIEDRINLLESYCLKTKASFKVKDRYRVN